MRGVMYIPESFNVDDQAEIEAFLQRYDFATLVSMPVLKVEPKFKLGQNRVAADRVGTVLGLEREGSAEAAALATFMRSYLKDVPGGGDHE